MSKVFIRKIKPEEIPLLKEFTYLAVYVPKGERKPDISIVELPELKLYYEDFGKKYGDICYVADIDEKIVGAVWCRVINDFGHIDNDTPSLAISLKEQYRNKGIGTKLLAEILTDLLKSDFRAVSLSVQKDNYAIKMYEDAGFENVKDNGDELIMKKRL